MFGTLPVKTATGALEGLRALLAVLASHSAVGWSLGSDQREVRSLP